MRRLSGRVPTASSRTVSSCPSPVRSSARPRAYQAGGAALVIDSAATGVASEFPSRSGPAGGQPNATVAAIAAVTARASDEE
jgi:hypothetical protein